LKLQSNFKVAVSISTMPYLHPLHGYYKSSHLLFQPSESSTSEPAPLVVHKPLPGPSYTEDPTEGNDTSRTTEDPTEDNDTSRTATHDPDQSHSSYSNSANPRSWLDSTRADSPLLPEEASLFLHTDPQVWLSSEIGKRLSLGWKLVDGDKCPTENCHQNSLVQLANKKVI